MTMPSLPLVSVVMPSLNQARFIETSVNSVLEQDYRNVELIVADGGSDDGTVQLLQRKAREDPRLRWFSEPDTGPANAVNKALDQARGTVFGWLNSDDVYTPGAVLRAVAALEANPGCLMLYGHGRHMDGGGDPLDSYPSLPPSTPIAQFSEGCFICQPTVFFRRTMWLLLGKLDEDLKAAFDFEYWLRAFLAFQHRIGFISEIQAESRLHDACITVRLRRTVALEGMQVLARHLGYAPKEWVLTYVNELLAMPPSQQCVGNLKAHIADTLGVVRPWLRPDDLRELELRLDKVLK
jgi:glycosyltransferase involved in cell wall biosynthesis